MCDGNLRSTIKALIMANEYLEAELEELQAAISAGCVPAPDAGGERRRLIGSTSDERCHVLRGAAVLPAGRRRLAGRGQRRGMPEFGNALRRAETMSRMPGSIGAVAFSRTGDPADRRIRRRQAAAGLRQRAGGSQYTLTQIRG